MESDLTQHILDLLASTNMMSVTIDRHSLIRLVSRSLICAVSRFSMIVTLSYPGEAAARRFFTGDLVTLPRMIHRTVGKRRLFRLQGSLCGSPQGRRPTVILIRVLNRNRGMYSTSDVKCASSRPVSVTANQFEAASRAQPFTVGAFCPGKALGKQGMRSRGL